MNRRATSDVTEEQMADRSTDHQTAVIWRPWDLEPEPLSAPKPSSLYPSLKGMQNDSTFKDVLTRITPAKKLEPEPMEREKISISRLGWNRDQELSSVRKFRCRTDANLKAAAFLSKY